MKTYDLNNLTWEDVFEIKFACSCQIEIYEKFKDERTKVIIDRLQDIINKCDKVRDI